MSNWTKRTLGEISDSCLGKMLDQEKNKGSFQPYLANLNVRWGDFSLESLQRMRFEDNEQDRYGLVYGDLVICEGGEPGRCAVWRNQMPNMKIQKALHRLRVKPGFSADFLYYRMLLAGRTGELSKYFIGSTIKHLTGISLKQVEFKFPNESEQIKIASVLRAIDTKIELNNRINAELEAMAKTLYDYWFVQFDFPFDFAQSKPDANGKPYKTSGGKMVYNPTLKREIPERWEVSELGEIAELYQPKTISEKEMSSDGKYLVYGANGIVGRYDSYNHEYSVVAITCRGNSCGEINVTRPFSWITGNAMVVNPINKFVSIDYLFNTLKRSGIDKVITGSAQPQITRTNLAPLRVISPPDQLVTYYSEKVSPSFEKRLAILDEIETLQKLRDWLLPMLMNGQITVK